MTDDRRRALRRAVAWAAPALLVAGTVLLLWYAPIDEPAPSVTRRSVAVLAFQDVSGHPDSAWLATALPERLTSELAAGEQLLLIPGDSVARVDADVSGAAVPSREALARIGRRLHADLVVLGSYTPAGTDVRVEVRLLDCASGAELAYLTSVAAEADLASLASRISALLRERLGIAPLSSSDAARLRSAAPESAEGARLYAEGLARLRAFDALSARDLLTKAAAADAHSPLVHSALAQAWSALGRDARALDEARKAFDLSAPLSREERLVIEARYREMTKEWDAAARAYRALLVLFPDRLDYGLRLAAVETSAGRGKDALGVVERLRRLRAPASDDPRIGLVESAALFSVSEFRGSQAAAARAASQAGAAGLRLVLARARQQEAEALRRLGQPEKASAAIAEAKRLSAEVGDRAGVARAVTLMGQVLRDAGELAAARAAYEEALDLAREIGDLRQTAIALNNVGFVLRLQGDLPGARSRHEQSLAIAREVGDKLEVAIRLNNIADVLRQQGDLEAAQRLYAESLALNQDVGDQRGVAICLNDAAEVRHLQGDLRGAERLLERSLAIRRGIGDRRGCAAALNSLGVLLAARGDLKAARRRHQEALALRTELGEKGGLAETRLALAALDLEDGRLAEASAASTAAAAEFRGESRSDDEALAQAVLARTLLLQRRELDAEQVLQRALATSSRTATVEVRLSVAIDAARVRVATGHPSEARLALKSVLAETEHAGMVSLRLEAALVLGEAELQSPDPAAGRERLEALEREAAERGFGLIARKARSVQR